MWTFLLFLIAFLLIIFPVIGLRILQGLFRAIFGKSNYTSKKQQYTTHREPSTHPKKKKIIDENEGEYIDFEEVIDDENDL